MARCVWWIRPALSPLHEAEELRNGIDATTDLTSRPFAASIARVRAARMPSVTKWHVAPAAIFTTQSPSPDGRGRDREAGTEM